MRVLDIIKKDLKILLSDKKALGIMIVMPIILTTILSFALKGSFMDTGGNVKKISIAIVKEYDMDENIKDFQNTLKDSIIGNSLNQEDFEKILEAKDELDIEDLFINEFLEDKDVNKILNYSIMEKDKAVELLNKGEISGIIVLPENFIKDIYINFFTPFRNMIEIKVIGSPDSYLGYQIVETIMKVFSDTISSMIIAKNVFLETALEENIGVKSYEDMGIIIEEMGSELSKNPVTLNHTNLQGRKPISSFAYYSVAMTTMFVLFVAGYGSKTLLEEKNNITYQRMVIGGASKWKIVSGKFFTMLVIGLLQIFIMVIYSSLVLKVDWGNPLLIFLASFTISFSVSGIGIMVSALTFRAGNYKMANAFETAIIQFFALVGGSFFPVDLLPGFLRRLSNFVPNGIALKSLSRIMMGYGFGDIALNLFMLIVIGGIFTLIGIYILTLEWGWRHAKYN